MAPSNFAANMALVAVATLLLLCSAAQATDGSTQATDGEAHHITAFNISTAKVKEPMSIVDGYSFFESLQLIADSMHLSELVRNQHPNRNCTYALAILGDNQKLAGANNNTNVPYLIVVTDETGAVQHSLKSATDLEFLHNFTDSFFRLTFNGLKIVMDSKGVQISGTFAFVCSTELAPLNTPKEATMAEFVPQLEFSQNATEIMANNFDRHYYSLNSSSLTELFKIESFTKWTFTLGAFPTSPAPTKGDDGKKDDGLSTGTIVGIVLGCICGTLVLIGFIAMKRKSREDAEYEKITGGPPKLENGSPVMQYYKDMDKMKKSGQQQKPHF